METAAFFILAALAFGSALVVITSRNAVISALALAFNLVSIAGFFFLLNAQFIGFLQVIVYAGAIMVLILFVLMLLAVQETHGVSEAGFFQRYLGPLLAIGLAAILIIGVTRASAGETFAELPPDFGTVEALGTELFTNYFYPFEAISLLLVVAMVGAVLLAKRRL